MNRIRRRRGAWWFFIGVCLVWVFFTTYAKGDVRGLGHDCYIYADVAPDLSPPPGKRANPPIPTIIHTYEFTERAVINALKMHLYAKYMYQTPNGRTWIEVNHAAGTFNLKVEVIK